MPVSVSQSPCRRGAPQAMHGTARRSGPVVPIFHSVAVFSCTRPDAICGRNRIRPGWSRARARAASICARPPGAAAPSADARARASLGGYCCRTRQTHRDRCRTRRYSVLRRSRRTAARPVTPASRPRPGRGPQQKTREALRHRGFQTTSEERLEKRTGAGDRTRTGKPIKAADFRHTTSFEAGAPRCARRSCAGLCLRHRPHAAWAACVTLGAPRLVSTPSPRAACALASGLARRCLGASRARGFAEFEGFCTGRFRPGTQSFKSAMFTNFITPARAERILPFVRHGARFRPQLPPPGPPRCVSSARHQLFIDARDNTEDENVYIPSRRPTP